VPRPSICQNFVFERVGVRRHSTLKVEKPVGVEVDLVLRRRRQPHEQRVVVFKNRPILLIHRAVRLIDDDEVVIPHPETPLPGLHLVDQPHHGRVGGNVHPALPVLVGDEIHRGGIRQMRLEGIHRLIHQRHAIREEQDALRPVAAHQQVAQRDHRPRLPVARRHHHQRLAVCVLLKCLADPPDGSLLIVALDDLPIDFRIGQLLAALPPLNH
jgi:hypothetical protein